MGISSVLTICVNYRNEDETCAFVRDVLRQKGDFHQRVVVVDNAMPPKPDSPLHRVFESDGRVFVLNPDGNLGYMRGAAWGLREHVSQAGLPDWIVVSNTDIEMMQPDFFSNLIKFHTSATPGVIAPAIISHLSGRDLNPHMETRPTRLRMRSYQLIFRYLPVASSYHAAAFAKAVLLKKYRTLRTIISPRTGTAGDFGQDTAAPRQVYAPQGAFVVFSRKYFESSGNLNHGAFLCGEELFIAETARRLGLAVVYDPRLRVAHKEHATLSRYTSRQLLAYVREATDYVTETFFSGSATRS